MARRGVDASDTLRRLREQRNMTQAEAAVLVGFGTPQEWTKYENGMRLGIGNARRIAEAFPEVTVAELGFGTNGQPGTPAPDRARLPSRRLQAEVVTLLLDANDAELRLVRDLLQQLAEPPAETG